MELALVVLGVLFVCGTVGAVWSGVVAGRLQRSQRLSPLPPLSERMRQQNDAIERSQFACLAAEEFMAAERFTLNQIRNTAK